MVNTHINRPISLRLCTDGRWFLCGAEGQIQEECFQYAMALSDEDERARMLGQFASA